jgi:hypothetical protein
LIQAGALAKGKRSIRKSNVGPNEKAMLRIYLAESHDGEARSDGEH